MAKIRIENLADKLLVTTDGKSANLYNKSEVSFSIDNYVLTMKNNDDIVQYLEDK